MNSELSSLIVAGVLLATPCDAEAAVWRKVMLLNGLQSGVPSTPGYGCGLMELDTDANTLAYRIVYDGLLGDEVAAHFHGPAGIGESADAIHLLPGGSPKVGVWSYPQSQEADIVANRVYVNIHTTEYLGGEIRGQLVDLIADLDGLQAGVAAGPRGYGLFTIDPCEDRIDFHVTFDPLSFNPADETGAAICGFGLHGDPAAPLLALPAGFIKNGTWSYDPDDETTILDGRASITISGVSGVVMRGQITRNVVPLDGLQPTTPVPDTGSGCGLVALDRDAAAMSVHLRHANLPEPVTGTVMHGPAAPGSDGDPIFSFASANPVLATWAYGAAHETTLLGGLAYVDVHTAANPPGEIRGQVQLAPPPCPADTNFDGLVDVDDLVNVIVAWQTSEPCPDIDGSGTVDVDDLIAVILAWSCSDGTT